MARVGASPAELLNEIASARRQVEDVVIGKLLAVKLLEVFGEAPAEHCRLVGFSP
jgi:hypothetical protein